MLSEKNDGKSADFSIPEFQEGKMRKKRCRFRRFPAGVFQQAGGARGACSPGRAVVAHCSGSSILPGGRPCGSAK